MTCLIHAYEVHEQNKLMYMIPEVPQLCLQEAKISNIQASLQY